jgi:uncharacterized membrane protein HdeD (DUF308 family)
MSDAARSYCRFAKRDLDKTSWLAPLVNNRIGDLLNIELRHEQLFFVEGGRITQDVGYSEKGRRFSETEYGRTLRTVEDLRTYGYWFVGREFPCDIMREALRRQRDGYYYSILSNQCQDWADRLMRGAERIERERGIAPSRRERWIHARDSDGWALPTEPSSIWMGLVALALGAGGFLAPSIAGGAMTVVLGMFFLAAGVSHIAYGLHAKDWRNLLGELITALIHLTVGALLLANRDLGRAAGSAIIGVSLVIHALVNLVLGLSSRPRSHWIGKLIAAPVLLASAGLIAAHWPSSGERTLGAAVGLSLFAGGLSTIYLSWRTRTAKAE